MANKSCIYPLAFSPHKNLTTDVFYVGFPAELKSALIELHKLCKKDYKETYGLATYSLKKLLWSWLDGVVDIKVLRAASDDTQWLTSCTSVDLNSLCEVIKIWILSEYTSDDTTIFAETKRIANMVSTSDFNALCTKDSALLFDADGIAQSIAYAAYPLRVINALLGKDIVVGGQVLHLHFCGKNQLISQRLPYNDKHEEYYSILFTFALQTIPPNRMPILLCTPSVRRWIKGCYHDKPFLEEAVLAHIQVAPDKFHVIPIQYNSDSKQIDWKASDKACYDLYQFQPLPNALEVIKNCSPDDTEILLPFHHRTSWAKKAYVGTGVSVRDKAEISAEIANLIQEFASPCKEATAIRAKWLDKCTEISMEQLLRCAGTNQLSFEIYANDSDIVLAEALEASLREDILPADFECIEIAHKDLGAWSEPLPDNTSQSRATRRTEIINELPLPNKVTACFVILPDKDAYQKKGDPKASIRAAFAQQERITQFITPLKDKQTVENISQRITKTKLDLYRQLGYLSPSAIAYFEKNFKQISQVPKAIGFVLHHQLVNSVGKKARFLPMFVCVDYNTAQITVTCNAFSKIEVSYREACLEMAKLSASTTFQNKCFEASRSVGKQYFIQLKALYDSDEPVLVLIESDGTTRAVCSGISDSELSKLELINPYQPSRLQVGDRYNPYQIDMNDTGVRLIRFRRNDEVPDYFTPLRTGYEDKHQQKSGLYKYDDIYWSICERPYQKEYTNSYRDSKLLHPNYAFAEKDMVEIYPIQLQENDDPDLWVKFANALRAQSLQFDQLTNAPLPIHLGNLLKEYIFKE